MPNSLVKQKMAEKENKTEFWTPRDEKIKELLKPYIFNEAEVLKEVPFTQFRSEKTDRFCMGLLHPRRYIDEKGERQEFQPIIITSGDDGKVPLIIEARKEEIQTLGVKLETIPGRLPKRYSLVAISKWLYQKAPEIDGKEVFHKIRETYEEFLYFAPDWYRVHAFWDISTYFFSLFPAFPYFELRGVKGAAKTKVMRVSGCFSFNASRIMTSPTEAALFRTVHDQRPTLYLDECENFFQERKGKIEPDSRIQVINSGYTRDGLVPRVEQIKQKWVTQYYSTYCPKMLASIEGLQGATESRAIVHIMTRAPDDDPRGEKEINTSSEKYRKIRDELLFFSLQNWRKVLEAYEELDAKATGLKKRNSQLWRPLLAVAKVIDEDEYQELRKVAQNQQDIGQASEVSDDSWEYAMIERMIYRLERGETKILLTDLADAVPAEKKPHSKTVRRIIDRLGFRDHYRHFSDGWGYEIFSLFHLKSIIPNIINNDFLSFPSLSSQEPEFCDSADEIMTESDGNTISDDGKMSSSGNLPDGKTQMSEMSENKGGRVEPKNFQWNPNNLLKQINGVYNKTRSPVDYTLLLKLRIPELDDWIKVLKNEGRIMESKPGVFVPL